ncbi:MAG: SDR family oxidoreductase [Deltaproteobacteria bacterium]|nr:SDR family oxidoreductase [Deltaproteobacteria bacterium]
MENTGLFDLQGQISVITGGARGIGLTISETLAQAGSDIIICSREITKYGKQIEHLQSLGVSCRAVKCDVSNPEEVKNLSEFIEKEFGRVDILVNNAGATWGAPVLDYPLDKWNKVMQVNVTGTFLCCQALGRMMIRQKKGKIINLSSVEGLYGGDPRYMDAVAYNTSKGAIITLTKDLAVKWASFHINVNTIAPGFMNSDMTQTTIANHGDKILSRVPMGRLGKSEDLKGSILFLASAASDYVTGQILFVDGGWHAM